MAINIQQLNAEIAQENDSLDQTIRSAIARGDDGITALAQLKATQAVHERLGDLLRMIAVTAS